MSTEISTNDLVQQLRRVGLRPSQKTIDAIKARGAEAVAPLLELATDVESTMGAEPGSLGPLHALRLLGEIKPVEAADPILRKLPLPVEEAPPQGAFLWAQEAPQIVANFGPDVLPTVLALADDMSAVPLQRGAAFATMGFLATTNPELRDEIVAELRKRMATEHEPTARGYLVATLSQLKARDAYDEIMASYRDKTVDKTVMGAATARQLLLGTQVQRQLDCALHSLDERYEQHGPYSEEQQRMMAEQARMQGR
jgi:hypothetical protein